MTKKQVLAAKYIVDRGFDKDDHPPITYQDVAAAFMAGVNQGREMIAEEILKIGENEVSEHGEVNA